jgi:uncharacterized membrane protein
MPAARPLVLAALAGIVVLGLAWELWLAPLRPGGSLLALKVLPIAAALPGLRRGHVRTYQWWSMLVLAYLMEGLVRGTSDAGLSARLAWIEVALATVGFVAILAHVKGLRRAG